MCFTKIKSQPFVLELHALFLKKKHLHVHEQVQMNDDPPPGVDDMERGP